jgi:hypothetical protein
MNLSVAMLRQIYRLSISNIEPKFEITSNSTSPKSILKKPTNQSLTSASIQEFKNLFDETKLSESSGRKKSRKQSLTTPSVRKEFINETLVIKNETKEWSNKTDNNDQDITDP